MKTVELENVAGEIDNIINNTVKKIVQKCSEELSNQADLLVKDISSTAPVSPKTGIHLRDTFVKTLYTSKRQKGIIINQEFRIHSEAKYQKYRIVHLLENGFYNTKAKRQVPGTKFMQTALNRRRRILTSKIKAIIQN